MKNIIDVFKGVDNPNMKFSLSSGWIVIMIMSNLNTVETICGTVIVSIFCLSQAFGIDKYERIKDEKVVPKEGN